MSGVVGVRFRRAGRVYFFDPAGVEGLTVGSWVIVDTARGPEAGQVAVAPSQVIAAELGELKPVLRAATWRELTEWSAYRTQEASALSQAREHIARHDLPMKAVRAEYNFDGSQLTIYFVTDVQRVDFRDLVRDLARAFRTRVHLHQIGPRDWAKLIGGFDRCGRELCCATWMTDFAPISIRMAKRQNLPLNPSEISGVCGKLLCCLAFEDDLYKDLQTGLPKVGATLVTATGRGKVVDVNVLTRSITIAWETGSRITVDADELAAQQARGAGPAGPDVEGGDDEAPEPDAVVAVGSAVPIEAEEGPGESAETEGDNGLAEPVEPDIDADVDGAPDPDGADDVDDA